MKPKIISIYGDSISTPLIGNGGYQVPLGKMLDNPVIYNHAIAASGMTATAPDSLIGVLKNKKNLHGDAEVILLWHGTNDWYWGSKLGDVSSSDENEFAGALMSSVAKLRESSPYARILYMTPLFRWQAPDGCAAAGEAWITQNNVGLTLRQYTEVLYECSRKMCFEVVDIRTISGFCYETAERYQPDFIHPSEEGCEIVAEILAEAILNHK